MSLGEGFGVGFRGVAGGQFSSGKYEKGKWKWGGWGVG